MLTITNVKKTFNKGTVNEKKALNGINLTPGTGRFRDDHRRKRCWKIHHVKYDRRRISDRFR